MKLESMSPLERIAYIAEQRVNGAPIRPFCVLASTLVHVPDASIATPVQRKVLELLGPVVVLEAAVRAVRNSLGEVGQIYLLGEQIVGQLAMRCGIRPEDSWSCHLETLACTGLIFRFPVAQEFGYVSPLPTQLRSSSWGSSAVAQFELHEGDVFRDIVASLEPLFSAH